MKLTSSQKLEALKKLTNKQKENFLPPKGATFDIGPFAFKVSHVNVGKLRFSAELVDVIEDKRDRIIQKPSMQEIGKVDMSKGLEGV